MTRNTIIVALLALGTGACGGSDTYRVPVDSEIRPFSPPEADDLVEDDGSADDDAEDGDGADGVDDAPAAPAAAPAPAAPSPAPAKAPAPRPAGGKKPGN